jgi:hypothetical protein
MQASKSHYTAVAASLLCCLAAPDARAELIEFDWSAAGIYERTAGVAPGKFVELCKPLDAGTRVAWQFETDALVSFNIHYHVDKTVVYPAKFTAKGKSKGTLKAALKQDYCWMWTNKTAAPLSLSIKLSKG